MPYITPTKRTKLDPLVEFMRDLDIKADGDLNYVLYKFCKKYVKPGYNRYKNYCAELKACAAEIERRLLAVYEDSKIKENGDI